MLLKASNRRKIPCFIAACGRALCPMSNLRIDRTAPGATLYSCTYFHDLRIDKGSRGGALHLGMCIHNYENYNDT